VYPVYLGGAEMNINNEISTSGIFYKRRAKIADAVIEAIDDLEPHWPLTVRQVYYQMVARMVLDNRQKNYHLVSQILVKLRENDLVPWRAITDRTRRTTYKRGVDNVNEWIADQLEKLFNPAYYGRCYVQSQNIHVEVTTEKDALSSIMEDICYWFCVRLNVIRGQNSATMNYEIAERLADAMMKGKDPVLLHFGDLDASGVAIPRAIKRILWERHDVDVDVRILALTPEQVEIFNLPTSVDACKPQDPNYKAWLQEYGPGQPMVELDALHPENLKNILEDGLKSVFDMYNFTEEQQKEIEDRQRIQQIRNDTLDFLVGRYPEMQGLRKAKY
jgi:hypothetical protein